MKKVFLICLYLISSFQLLSANLLEEKKIICRIKIENSNNVDVINFFQKAEIGVNHKNDMEDCTIDSLYIFKNNKIISDTTIFICAGSRIKLVIKDRGVEYDLTPTLKGLQEENIILLYKDNELFVNDSPLHPEVNANSNSNHNQKSKGNSEKKMFFEIFLPLFPSDNLNTKFGDSRLGMRFNLLLFGNKELMQRFNLQLEYNYFHQMQYFAGAKNQFDAPLHIMLFKIGFLLKGRVENINMFFGPQLGFGEIHYKLENNRPSLRSIKLSISIYYLFELGKGWYLSFEPRVLYPVDKVYKFFGGNFSGLSFGVVHIFNF